MCKLHINMCKNKRWLRQNLIVRKSLLPPKNLLLTEHCQDFLAGFPFAWCSNQQTGWWLYWKSQQQCCLWNPPLSTRLSELNMSSSVSTSWWILIRNHWQFVSKTLPLIIVPPGRINRPPLGPQVASPVRIVHIRRPKHGVVLWGPKRGPELGVTVVH